MSASDLERFEVQCGRTIHQACTFSVAARTKEDACRVAIALADRAGNWKDTDAPISEAFVDAIGPDESGAWSSPDGGEAAVPYGYTQAGMFFALPWRPAGQVAIVSGTYLVEFVSPDTGSGVAYGAFQYDADEPDGSRWSELTSFEKATIEAVRVCPYPTPENGPRAFQLPGAFSIDDVAILVATIRDFLMNYLPADTAMAGDDARLGRILRALAFTPEEAEAFDCAEFRRAAPDLFSSDGEDG